MLEYGDIVIYTATYLCQLSQLISVKHVDGVVIIVLLYMYDSICFNHRCSYNFLVYNRQLGKVCLMLVHWDVTLLCLRVAV